jgi:hypothetical protein
MDRKCGRGPTSAVVLRASTPPCRCGWYEKNFHIGAVRSGRKLPPDVGHRWPQSCIGPIGHSSCTEFQGFVDVRGHRNCARRHNIVRERR